MTETTRTIRIGTRGSPLALAQAHEVRDRLLAAHPHLGAGRIEIVAVSTKGDRIQDRSLSELGGKGLFTEEIENGLLNRSLDIAVHCMKDMPTVLPDGLVIDCLLERADPRDAFISLKAGSLAELPASSRVGTSSLRRAAQLKARRPDLEVVPFRGNVDTRLRKLNEGVADATFLAVAGLTRMGLADKITAPLSAEEMLPAVAQGAIGIERRAADDEAAHLLEKLHHVETGLRVAAERAFLAVLDGSCRTPIAALAEIAGKRMRLRAMILTPDGAEIHETEREGLAADAVALGEDAGEELKGRAGPNFFAAV